MKIDNVTRRGFIKAGATGLGALALGAQSVPGSSAAPASDQAAAGQVRIAVVQQESVPGAVEKNHGARKGPAGHVTVLSVLRFGLEEG